MVARKGENAILNGMHPFTMTGKHLLPAMGADKPLFAYHLDKVLLRVGYVLLVAMRALDDPLGL